MSSTSRIVGADDSVRPVSLSLRKGRRPRRPVSARLLFRSIGAGDSVCPVLLSFRRGRRPRRPASQGRTTLSAPFPCHSEPVRALAWESVSPCLPLRGRWQRVALTEGAISHGNSSPPVARADSPLPAGALQRGAAALTGRRTPRAFVPLRSTAGRRPLRAVQRIRPIGRLALRPPFIPAGVSSRAAEQSIPPVMQCAHLPFRRQQASSHPLTCHGMVP